MSAQRGPVSAFILPRVRLVPRAPATVVSYATTSASGHDSVTTMSIQYSGISQ